MRSLCLSIGVAALLVGAAEAKERPADLVAACQAESEAGHAAAWRLEPSLRAVIDTHRARMNGLCARMRDAAEPGLLDECLAEAARGPRHVQRGRNMDRDHVARQKRICRELAAK